jgi:hypothetical protein
MRIIDAHCKIITIIILLLLLLHYKLPFLPFQNLVHLTILFLSCTQMFSHQIMEYVLPKKTTFFNLQNIPQV